MFLDKNEANNNYSNTTTTSEKSGELPVRLQVFKAGKTKKRGDVVSSGARNLTESMEPEFQVFCEGEISPVAVLRSK